MSTPQCRAGCGVPLDPFLVEPDGDGLHANCKGPIGPVLPRLSRILDRHQAGMARSRQRSIGPSQVGDPCDRALAYRLHGVPQVRDDGLKWAPLLGTWAHAGIAEALAQENERLGRERYLIERRVEIAPPLLPGGQVDCYDQDTDEVIDWKLVGKTSLAHKRRHGPGAVYRVQAHCYALGWQNAGYTPAGVRVVFLPKWSVTVMDGWEWSEAYRPDVAHEAVRRLARVQRLGAVLAVDKEPRNWALIPAAPGDANCAYCPWRRGGGPADASGCPGNTEELHAKAEATFGRGLVA